MPGIQEALDEIRALKPDEKIVYTTIAKKMALIAQRCRAQIDSIRFPDTSPTIINGNSANNKSWI
jgi:3-oxoacyl-ACP reductase-like protein